MRKVFLLFAIFSLPLVSCENPLMAEILGLPENLSVEERWYTWTETESGAEITHSVNTDGVCTITVVQSAEPVSLDGGGIDVCRWKATANYLYTAKANTSYQYVFEAWTEVENSTRNLDIAYYNAYDGDGTVLELDGFPIDHNRTTYTITGNQIIKDRKRPDQWGSLEFHCADQLGTFYVRIISITPVS